MSKLRMAMVHDCGQPINEMLVEGQLEGSTIGGVGHALTEEIFRKEGQKMNPSFLDVGMPALFWERSHLRPLLLKKRLNLSAAKRLLQNL